jgi:nicotinate-nucleotide adenylyltransferase
VTPRLVLPPHAPGLRIGLLGGSFNPAHEAHRALSLFAMKRLGLDRVWWLVSPGNPLKDSRAQPPLAQRLAGARGIARHPRIDVSGLEAALGTRYTIDTVRALRRRAPHVRFVWIMGADNLSQFHRWRNWRGVADALPLAAIDRPADSLRALASPAGQALARYRLADDAARRLALTRAPAWVFLRGLKSPLSSTAIRNRAMSHA